MPRHPKANFVRIRPEMREIHTLLMDWSYWLVKYSEQRAIPLKQIYGGGVLSNKRSAIFRIPKTIQRVDLAIAATTRAWPKLSHVLYEGYLGEGPWPEKAKRLHITPNTMTLSMRYARSAVLAAYKALESRDLMERGSTLLQD